jgi:RimJ/RimL family protein N-acetyltransferase
MLGRMAGLPMSLYIFHTDRLSCRRWVPDDFEALVRVYGDADAMRWVGDGVAITPDQCKHWFEVTENNYRARGYGMFALEDRSTSLVVGFCGLVHPGGQTDAEIMYAFERQYWGRGLASEAAKALLTYGAREHGLLKVIATTAPDNHASHRVLLKAGMSPAGTRDNSDGSQTKLFVWQPGKQENAA